MKKIALVVTFLIGFSAVQQPAYAIFDALASAVVEVFDGDDRNSYATRLFAKHPSVSILLIGAASLIVHEFGHAFAVKQFDRNALEDIHLFGGHQDATLFRVDNVHVHYAGLHGSTHFHGLEQEPANSIILGAGGASAIFFCTALIMAFIAYAHIQDSGDIVKALKHSLVDLFNPLQSIASLRHLSRASKKILINLVTGALVTLTAQLFYAFTPNSAPWDDLNGDGDRLWLKILDQSSWKFYGMRGFSLIGELLSIVYIMKKNEEAHSASGYSIA